MSIPVGLNFNFFIQNVFPGLFFSFLTYPIYSTLFDFIKTDMKINYLYWMLGIGFFFSILLYFSGDCIYQIVLGRSFWPHKFKEWRRKRWQNFINKLEEKIKEQEKKGSHQSHIDELEYKLRAFPLDDKNRYHSLSPTKLGNIIYGYEGYSLIRYGMDSTFYGFRIWLKLDRNSKNEAERYMSLADSGVYTFFVFFVVSIIYALFIISSIVIVGFDLSKFQTAILPKGPPFAWALTIFIVTFIMGVIIYKLAINLHRSYGEFFKAMFDLNKGIVRELCDGYSKEDFDIASKTSNFLQYNSVSCPSCGRYKKAHLEKCKRCDIELPYFFDCFKNKKSPPKKEKEVRKTKKDNKD